MISEWNKSIWLTRSAFMPGQNWLVNGAILKGEKMALVWETLAYPADMQAVSFLLAKFDFVVAAYSHADWDHCLGTNGFSFSNVIAQQNAIHRFKFELPATLKKLNAKYSKAWEDACPVPPDFVFSDKLNLDFGSFRLELSSFPGHTPDGMVGYIPEYKVLLAGDSVEEIPVINDPKDVPSWIDHLKKWLNEPDIQTVLPGHGEITDLSLLEENLKYLIALTEKSPVEIETDNPFYLDVHQENCKLMGCSVGK